MLNYNDIVGHSQIKEHLKKAVAADKVSHAYILSGEPGMGRKSIAHAFAMSLLCEKGGVEPCFECHACKQVIAGTHPDLIHVTHEKASIGVDDIREQVSDTVDIRPYSSFYKIYIIDDAEKMTVQAQNALLKTIEEPPSYAIIILLATNEELLLDTIRSRCVSLILKPLSDDVVQQYLESRLSINADDASVYAACARGNLGRAIELASSKEFKNIYEENISMLRNIKNADTRDILKYIDTIKARDNGLDSFFEFCRLWYRDILMYKATVDINRLVYKKEFKALSEASKRSDYAALERVLEAIDKAQTRIKANVNTDLTLELLLMAMKEN